MPSVFSKFEAWATFDEWFAHEAQQLACMVPGRVTISAYHGYP